MGTMAEATDGYVLIDGLKALASRLAVEIDGCGDQKVLATLSRQYRETMNRIDELEGAVDEEDDVAAIISRDR